MLQNAVFLWWHTEKTFSFWGHCPQTPIRGFAPGPHWGPTAAPRPLHHFPPFSLFPSPMSVVQVKLYSGVCVYALVFCLFFTCHTATWNISSQWTMQYYHCHETQATEYVKNNSDTMNVYVEKKTFWMQMCNELTNGCNWLCNIQPFFQVEGKCDPPKNSERWQPVRHGKQIA